MRAQRAVPASVIVAAVVDAALVLVFALVGRASHGEGLLGILTTWWPFLGGLAIGSYKSGTNRIWINIYVC